MRKRRALICTIRNRETFAKRGPLAILRDPTSNEWKKFWFVLRRPYLHLYSSSGEVEEVAVINISTVRVEQSPEIEQMLDVSAICGSICAESVLNTDPARLHAAQVCLCHLYSPKLVNSLASVRFCEL